MINCCATCLIMSYLICIPCDSTTCSLYISSAVWRLVVLSPALNTESRVVRFMEFGLEVFTSWRFSLKLPRPLSPPSFNQSSVDGMAPLCHVKPGPDLWYNDIYCIPCNYYPLHLSCPSTKSAIAAIRLGRLTKGTSLISSLPLSEEKVKAPLYRHL